MSRVDLFWIGGETSPEWPLGRVMRTDATVLAVHEAVENARGATAPDAWLFWGARLGPPDPERVTAALSLPGDVWHGGLRLGMGGLPASIDFVTPTWMLNRDPDPAIEATSWRVSLDACLARADVVCRLGGIRREFETLDGAALELGHRWITRGALMRHVPRLLATSSETHPRVIPFIDEMRFVKLRFGRFWLRWSLLRSVLTRQVGPWRANAVRRSLEREPSPRTPIPLRDAAGNGRASGPVWGPSVTVLIPTVDRYAYLEKLLEQLRSQTVCPLEIILVDQTSRHRRRTDLASRFPDLPLRVLQLDEAGQCSSRNLGIEASRGDYILFVDDDDEVPRDLIEKHLTSLARFGAEVSCGVADEVGAGPLPENFLLVRASDVFPTNNSLVIKNALSRSGLFDLAYDRGARADADLGMRLYLGGCLMVLNPEIRVLHHHAPSGGLRKHKARVITYASSRSRLAHRHLPAKTEAYLGHRYFSRRQNDEMSWLYAAGTLSARGGAWRRTMKAVLGLALLPHTLWRISTRSREAAAMLEAYPRIPTLSDVHPEATKE